jgi:PAS domain S-box-containing protein/diguanylate cyclase (GGDEF)-like protein
MMMSDQKKTKKQLVEELDLLRKKNSELEEIKLRQIEDLRKANEAMRYGFPILEQQNDGIFVIFDRQFEFVNQKIEDLFGYSMQEICGTGFELMSLIAPESRKFVRRKLDEGYRGEFNAQQFEFTGIKKDSRKIECYTSIIFIPYKWGVAIHGVLNDISVKKRINDELQKPQDNLQIALDSIPTSIFYTDRSHRFFQINDAFSRLLGLPREEILNRNISELFPHLPEKQFAQYSHDNQQVMDDGRPKRGIIEMFPSTVGRKWIQADKMPYVNEKSEVEGVVCLAIDITNIRDTEEKLWYLSFHDVFTGLYNKAFFEEEILRLEGGRFYPFTFIEAIVTNYTEVNHKHGISAGNDLVKKTAAVLRTFRTEDIVARIDDNCFAVLLPMSSKETGESIAARLKGLLDKQATESGGIFPEVQFEIRTVERETPLANFLKKVN